MELLKAFGEVVQFNLMRDGDGNSKGTAVFEYKDADMASLAIKGLNSLTIGGQKLQAQVRHEGVPRLVLYLFDTSDSMVTLGLFWPIIDGTYAGGAAGDGWYPHQACRHLHCGGRGHRGRSFGQHGHS